MRMEVVVLTRSSNLVQALSRREGVRVRQRKFTRGRAEARRSSIACWMRRGSKNLKEGDVPLDLGIGEEQRHGDLVSTSES